MVEFIYGKKNGREDDKIALEKCAFCGRNIEDVEKLIKAPDSNIYICDVCAGIVFNLSGDSARQRETRKKRKELSKAVMGTGTVKKGHAATPAEIRRELDRYVIGQEKAKKTLSVAVYNHSKRLKDKSGLIKKSNILMIGPSGCGKTLLARTIAKMLDVPFAMVDATSLTETGYVGDDVDVCLQRLLEAAGGDVDLAQKGIVYIDEIDKIACKESGVRDVGGGAVQAALLKLIEGSEVSVPANGNRRNPNTNYVNMCTTDILFVCGGAFDGIMDKKGKKHDIGFCSGGRQPETAESSTVNAEDIVRYGMMPEFAGRLPVICTLDGLTEKDFVRILTEPEDAITKEYELLLKKDGIRLIIEPEALEKIARIAAERKTGARGIRSILEDLMLDVMYQAPDHKDISKCVITAESIQSGMPAIIKKRAGKQKNGGLDTSAGAEAQRYREGGC